MTFRYESIFSYVIALCVFSCMAYIISNRILVSLLAFVIISVVYLVLRQRRITFCQDYVDVKSSLLKSKNFKASYTDLKEVKIEKIYSTTFTNIIVRFTFNVNDKLKNTSISLDNYQKISQLISLLKNKEVNIIFSDEYVNMLFNKD